jgi:hypothetical protein
MGGQFGGLPSGGDRFDNLRGQEGERQQAADVPIADSFDPREFGDTADLVFFVFDLLFLDAEDLTHSPLAERKPRLAELLSGTTTQLQYSDHQAGRGLIRVHRPETSPSDRLGSSVAPTDGLRPLVACPTRTPAHFA